MPPEGRYALDVDNWATDVGTLVCLSVILAVALVGLAWAWRRTRRRRRAALANGSWWQVTPPRTLPNDGALPVWNQLALLLDAKQLRGRCLAATMTASGPGRVRLGLWIPGDIPAAAVVGAVRSAWPGTVLQRQSRPPLRRRTPNAVVEVRPVGASWGPLIDHREHVTHDRRRQQAVDEPLRGLWSRLIGEAAAGRTASVQVVVSRARVVRAGNTVGDGLSVDSVVALLGKAARELVLGMLDVIQSPTSTRTSKGGRPSSASTRADDPLVAERRKAALAKRVSGPHLKATVRVVVTGNEVASRLRSAAFGLANNLIALALDPATATCHRVLFAGRSAAEYRHGRAFVASTRELDALWHLPTHPGEHGIDAPRAVYAAPHTTLPAIGRARERTPAQQSRDEQTDPSPRGVSARRQSHD